MDKKAGELKAANYSMTNSAFSDQIPAPFSLFDTPSSLNFMDLFGCHDYSFSSDICDFFQPPPPPPPPVLLPPLMPPPPVLSPATTVPESSEVVNTPATPNSTSISSSFTDTLNDDQLQSKRVDEEEADEKSPKKPKQLKAKKKEKMKVKQARFAFMTKSEIDHLDDGYRWRKYGQKAVKNSPFPRSYYRCTSSQCNVKKRVERSSEDHAIVVTTYEGTHIHPCPITCRGTFGVVSSAETPSSSLLGNIIPGFITGGGGGGYLSAMQYQQRHQAEQQQYFSKEPPPTTLNSSNIVTSSSLSQIVYRDEERRFSPRSACFFTDGGLLQDIVTSQILKEPKEE